MRRRLQPLLAVVALAGLSADAARAQAVLVSLQLEHPVIAVGGSTTLRVLAQIQPSYRSGADRIFSWYVDVLNTNGLAARGEYTQMVKAASDQAPQTASTGVSEGADRRGIYDTFLGLPGAGRDAPVVLMSIPVTGAGAGRTRFAVAAGTGVAGLSADFLVAPAGGGDPWTGGIYTNAIADLEVVSSSRVIVPLQLRHATGGGATNQATLQFPVIPGLDYYLESSEGLSAGSWQTLPGGPHNGGVLVDRSPAVKRFFRLRIEPARGGTP